MIIQLAQDCGEREQAEIEAALAREGFHATAVTTEAHSYLVAVGGPQAFDVRRVGTMPGVHDVHVVSETFKLVSRKWKTRATVIDLGNSIEIGEGRFSFMAGPCSIEDEAQIRSVAAHLTTHGVRIMRGGAFKPRSSPYTFRGGGLEALKMFHEIAVEAGLKVISEVVEPSHVEEMHPYVDIFQVGARNSQNFSLLSELGRARKPVLVKRGLSGTIEELLQSAEYIFSSGNEQIMLCERGIRSYESAYRNTFDINAIALLKEKTHLPVIADPSHGVGIRRMVEPVALAAIAAGADGILVEIHPEPEAAKSDGAQTLNFEESARLFERGRSLVAWREV